MMDVAGEGMMSKIVISLIRRLVCEVRWDNPSHGC